MKLLVDSGSTCNAIDRDIWEYLKKMKIKCSTRLEEKNIYAYGSDRPLPVKASFTANVRIGNASMLAKFYVIDKNVEPIIGCETAKALNILKIGRDEIARITEGLEQIGKLKNFY